MGVINEKNIAAKTNCVQTINKLLIASRFKLIQVHSTICAHLP